MNIRNIIQKPFRYSFNNITIYLIAINAILFVAGMLFRNIYDYLALYPPAVYKLGFFWQPLTYMFMHDPTNFNHIIFNMLGLLMFGLQLERAMGSKEFLMFYLVTGVLTGLTAFLVPGPIVLIGASGAIYALLLAFATLFPEARILLFFVIPMRAPLAVLVFAVIAFASQIFDTSSNIAHFAHLAGIVFGFLYFIIRLGINPITRFRRR